jgi:N-acetylmuramoyl-L-alanine amidase
LELDTKGYFSPAARRYISPDEAVLLKHPDEAQARYWHKYTENQLDACMKICRLLKEKYGIHTILGHSDIAKGRKFDPGPALDIDSFRSIISEPERLDVKNINVKENNNSAEVTASVLNIRNGPGTEFDTLPWQLKKGDKIDILSEKNGWLEIEVKAKAWVSAKFVDKK